MKTIAVIGSLFFWDNIKEYFKEFPKVQFIHFPYTVPVLLLSFLQVF